MKGAKRGMSTGTLALIVAMLLGGCTQPLGTSIVGAEGSDSPTDGGRLINEPASLEDVDVRIVVTTTGETGSVFYSVFDGSQLDSARVTFTDEWVVDETYQTDPTKASFSVIADSELEPGDILSCTLEVNGVVIETVSVEGGRFFSNGIASCLYDAADPEHGGQK